MQHHGGQCGVIPGNALAQPWLPIPTVPLYPSFEGTGHIKGPICQTRVQTRHKHSAGCVEPSAGSQEQIKALSPEDLAALADSVAGFPCAAEMKGLRCGSPAGQGAPGWRFGSWSQAGWVTPAPSRTRENKHRPQLTQHMGNHSSVHCTSCVSQDHLLLMAVAPHPHVLSDLCFGLRAL